MIIGKTHFYRAVIDFDLLDSGNVLYHPNYLVLCERARNTAIEMAGYPFAEMWAEGYCLALTETRSSYRRPAPFGRSLWMATTVTESTGATITVHQELVRPATPVEEGFVDRVAPSSTGELYYELDVKLACLKVDGLRPTRFPPRLVSALQIPMRRVAA